MRVVMYTLLAIWLALGFLITYNKPPVPYKEPNVELKCPNINGVSGEYCPVHRSRTRGFACPKSN